MPVAKHHGTSTSAWSHGYGPVTDPMKTDSPIASASMSARRNESRGAPTSETTAIRLAPSAMAMAARVLPNPRPRAKTATTGRAVMAPTTGRTSIPGTRGPLRGRSRGAAVTGRTPAGAPGGRTDGDATRPARDDLTQSGAGRDP